MTYASSDPPTAHPPERDAIRDDVEATMRIVWWAVGSSVGIGLACRLAGLITLNVPAILTLACGLLGSSVVSLRLTRRARNPMRPYFAGHLVNVVIVTIAIHYVGGVEFLPGPLLYTLIIVNGGIVVSWPAHVLAFASAVSYGTLAAVEVSGWWPAPIDPSVPATRVDQAAWPAIVVIVAVVFHVTAAYAGRLARVLRERAVAIDAYRTAAETETTARRRAIETAEQAEGELRERSIQYRTFAQIVTHDLKNPINAIYLTADMLLTRHDAALGPEVRRAIERICRMSEGAEAKIADLMKFFRIQAKEETQTWVHLDELVHEAIDELREHIDRKGISVTVGPLPVVWGQHEKLGYVVNNLLSNAVKYVHCRAGVIRVSGTSEPSASTLAVEDNGIGIPAVYQPRIFDLFARVPDAEQAVEGAAPGGTGVGLALVKRIVEQHRGHVTVSSEIAHGSRFLIHFPSLDGGAAHA